MKLVVDIEAGELVRFLDGDLSILGIAVKRNRKSPHILEVFMLSSPDAFEIREIEATEVTSYGTDWLSMPFEYVAKVEPQTDAWGDAPAEAEPIPGTVIQRDDGPAIVAASKRQIFELTTFTPEPYYPEAVRGVAVVDWDSLSDDK